VFETETMYLKKTYPNNPYRPNTGVFKDRSYTTAVAVGGKLNPSNAEYGIDELLKATKLTEKYGYEDCSREEYQKIVKDNAEFELSITKPDWIKSKRYKTTRA